MIQWSLRPIIGITVIVAGFLALVQLENGLLLPFIAILAPAVVFRYWFSWPSLFLVFWAVFFPVHHFFDALLFFLIWNFGMWIIVAWCEEEFSDTIDE